MIKKIMRSEIVSKVVLLVGLMGFVMVTHAVTKPTIEILATGGTIAGVASSQTSTTYQAGSLTAKQLIQSVNGLGDLAHIQYQQVYNKDSGNITLSDWLKLAAAVQKAASNPAVQGIVITHGTDTLGETAYFLDLIAKTTKPIVIVGSMRPATSMSADGPLNLYNAVAVAADSQSPGRGVLVVMNDTIFAGREVEKTNTTSVQTFAAPNTGPVGHVLMGEVSYDALDTHPNTVNTPFSVKGINQLPDVEIVYEYVGVNPQMLYQILATPGLQGLVIAGVGDGNIPDYEASFLEKARARGIVIVRSSRVGSGTVTYNYNNLDTQYGLITANDLNPQKARILLMLSLLKTHNIRDIQAYFNQY